MQHKYTYCVISEIQYKYVLIFRGNEIRLFKRCSKFSVSYWFSHFMKVVQLPIPKDKQGQTFSHIFGTNTSRYVARVLFDKTLIVIYFKFTFHFMKSCFSFSVFILNRVNLRVKSVFSFKSLELLLIGRKLKGPSWIEIRYPRKYLHVYNVVIDGILNLFNARSIMLIVSF